MRPRRAPYTARALSVLAAALLFAGSSESAEITFDQLIAGGTLSYLGDGGPVRGRDIAIDQIQGQNTPQNDGVILTCIGCELNFDTGNNISEGPTVWTWSGGGFLTITGTVPGVGIVAPTTLLTGEFQDTPTAEFESGRILFTGTGTDMKAEALVEFYFGANPPDGFFFEVTEITAQDSTLVSATGAFSGNIAESDVVNTQPSPPTPVPEPSTTALLLTGLGFLASAAAARRRRR